MNLAEYMATAVSPDGINWQATTDSVSFLDIGNTPMLINNTKRIGDVGGIVMPDNEFFLYTNYSGLNPVGPSRDIIRIELQNQVVGFSTEENSSDVIIAPNPTSQYVGVTIDKNNIRAPYSVLDTQGKIILQGVLTQEKTTFELGQLPNGIYLLRVGESSKRIRVLRVLKNN